MQKQRSEKDAHEGKNEIYNEGLIWVFRYALEIVCVHKTAAGLSLAWC